MSAKPYKTYEELVCKLRDEKNLSIPDEARVIELLKKHSYFSLVSGYKALFKQTDGTYLPGTTIEDLLALFEFDNQLRAIFFSSIQIIEKHIKSLLSHTFVAKYGDEQKEYLNPLNYSCICATPKATYSKCEEVRRLVHGFKCIVTSPFDHKYIEHQWNAHRNVPLWVCIKAVTLGTTSKMYSLCTQDVQATISKEFPVVTEHQLVGMLDLLTRIRNVCAHNERLYDFNTGGRRAIQGMPLHTQLGIGRVNGSFKKGQCDLFAGVVCFKYLLSDEEFTATMNEIKAEITLLCSRTKKFPENKILSCMGFPPNWYDSITY